MPDQIIHKRGITVFAKRALLLAGICGAVYFPALNNGFIADDYVFLEWASKLKSDFWFLFTVPPNNFRMTTYLIFGALKAVFGYRSEVFYVVAILLHFLNCLLLYKLIERLSSSTSAALLAAVVFAVFHAPQEAILWVAGMGEMLGGLSLLLSLLCWLNKRYVLAIIIFFLGLFSKESTLSLLALIPLIQWQRNEKLFPREYFLFFIPSSVFVTVFLWTWSSNSFIQHGIYDYRLHAVFVLLKTVNRLFWPWLYIPLIAWIIVQRRWPDFSSTKRYLLWLLALLLPYIFLTYQNSLPSRHVYLASMVIAAGIAFLLIDIKEPLFRNVFLVAFLAYNIGYLWFRKDHQFEQRARPTTELLKLLRSHSPTQLMIFDFPYTEPDVAKDVSFLVPGWSRDLVGVNGTGEFCSQCVVLRWDAKSETYLGSW